MSGRILRFLRLHLLNIWTISCDHESNQFQVGTWKSSPGRWHQGMVPVGIFWGRHRNISVVGWYHLQFKGLGFCPEIAILRQWLPLLLDWVPLDFTFHAWEFWHAVRWQWVVTICTCPSMAVMRKGAQWMTVNNAVHPRIAGYPGFRLDIFPQSILLPLSKDTSLHLTVYHSTYG